MRNKEGYSVSGPGYEKLGLPVVGAAIVAAQGAAQRVGTDGAWYVRGPGSERPLYAIERKGKTVWTTRTPREVAA